MRFFGLFCFFIGQSVAMPADADQINWSARFEAVNKELNEAIEITKQLIREQQEDNKRTLEQFRKTRQSMDHIDK